MQQIHKKDFQVQGLSSQANRAITLDIGCGHGFKTCTESKHNYTIGIDYDEENIKICLTRYPNNIFVIMDAEKLGVQSLICAKVIIHDVLEHVVAPDSVVTEAYRVLQNKGILDIIVPHSRSEKILAWLRPTYLDDIGHRRVFVDDKLPNTIKASGFYIESSKLVGFLQTIYLCVVLIIRRGISQSNGDTSIFDWRSHWLHALLHIIMVHFDPVIWDTPLRYSPIALFTVPVGRVIESLFAHALPKSQRIVSTKLT